MPNSLPALVKGILQSHTAWHVRSAAAWFETAPLVPAYHVPQELSPAEQAQRAAQAVLELAQKLDRLPRAYPHWDAFEPGPYFDLYPVHAARFCRAEETARVVRVRLYADLLLPAFRQAERYWAETFLPAYHAGIGAEETTGHNAFRSYLLDEVMPEMICRLDRAEAAVQGVLDLLSDTTAVLQYSGAVEERILARLPPGARPAPGLPPALQRVPRRMPTLTLDLAIPRPQPPGRSAHRLWPQRERHSAL
ncbi:MAG: hypothetical protein NZ528_15355 [Caldilineales bacterium]|nr:hypothetical protein [Caldilineales bacterium]MDW8317370.1 hypothetical protein [Anaerolineae bacterium]